VRGSGLRRDVALLAAFLDHEVKLMPGNHVLHVGKLVTDQHSEAPWMGAHLLVLNAGQLKQLVASQPRALANERDRVAVGASLDRLIDRAERGLVEAHASAGLVAHSRKPNASRGSAGELEAHGHAGARAALLDLQLISRFGNEPKSETEPGTVMTRRQADAIISDAHVQEAVLKAHRQMQHARAPPAARSR
jgi:hypothetical protein